MVFVFEIHFVIVNFICIFKFDISTSMDGRLQPHLQGGVQVFHGVVHEGALLPTLLCSLQRYHPNIAII
jgi:hypothetical protein